MVVFSLESPGGLPGGSSRGSPVSSSRDVTLRDGSFSLSRLESVCPEVADGCNGPAFSTAICKPTRRGANGFPFRGHMVLSGYSSPACPGRASERACLHGVVPTGQRAPGSGRSGWHAGSAHLIWDSIFSIIFLSFPCHYIRASRRSIWIIRPIPTSVGLQATIELPSVISDSILVFFSLKPVARIGKTLN